MVIWRVRKLRLAAMGNLFIGGRRSSGKQKLLKKLNKMKELLDIAISCLPNLRHRCHSRCLQYRADIEQLLNLYQSDRALHYAEWVVEELNMLDVFSMVESYCIVLQERDFLFLEQRGKSSNRVCPEELQEAVAGLVYVAARCEDLPALREVRCIFTSIIGKDFTDAVAELRISCGVSNEMVLKYSKIKPSLASMLKIVREIAIEKGIKLDLAEPIVQIAMEPQIELPVNVNLMALAREKWKDVESATQAAISLSAFSAAAVKTAFELYELDSHWYVESASLRSSRGKSIFHHK